MDRQHLPDFFLKVSYAHPQIIGDIGLVEFVVKFSVTDEDRLARKIIHDLRVAGFKFFFFCMG